MRTNQTLAFAECMLQKYSFDKPRQKMTILEAFKKLENYVDSSDPDVRYGYLLWYLFTYCVL